MTTAIEKQPADQAARKEIVENLGTTMLVEAAAGTGKTTSLVLRMMNLVRSGTPASTIAAITFTIKAAAQLRERFQEGLERAVRESGSAAESEHFRRALADVDRGFIGTTHAFCGRLLHERPVEAGLDPEFEQIEGAEGALLSGEFWDRWYDEHAAVGDPAISDARRVGLDRKLLREVFLRLIDHPDVVFVSTRTPAPDLRQLCERVFDQLDIFEPHLPTRAHPHEPDEFAKMLFRLRQSRHSTDLVHDLWRQIAFLEEAAHHKKITQYRWPEGKKAKLLWEDYCAFVDNVVKPGLRSWREHVHGIAMDVVRPAIEEFSRERRRKGSLTFQDLLLCARDMLRDHAAVRRYFQRRFTHVLVDEFQDTDPLQAEVLFYLTGEDVDEKDWRKLRPKPGSLFIVGDPKQAIYRFRRADITTYVDVRKRIETSGGKVLALSTNFRSAPAICSFVNGVFSDLFTKADVAAERQAPHVDLDAYHDPSPPAGVYLLETQHDSKPEVAQREAEWIASWVGTAVRGGFEIECEGKRRGLQWSDVLLVSWQTPRLHVYARALEAAGIPYEVTGSRAFKAESALERVMSLLRAVAAPDDPVSVLAFLRGSFCGADDDALYRFVRAKGSFSPFIDPPTETDSRIVRGLDLIRTAIAESRSFPPAAVIARVFDRLGIIAAAAAADEPGTRSGTLLLALSRARQASAGGASFAEIVEILDGYLTTKNEIEELDVDPARSNAVRLMNLHKVKGLEAPVVFLVDPTEEYDFPIDMYVDRSGTESKAHVAISTKFGRSTKEVAFPAGWDALEQHEREFKIAEKQRQLYVAATRARNLLIIGFTMNKGESGAWRELAKRANQTFAPALGNVPVETEVNPPAREFREAVDRIHASLESAKVASYSVLPITKIAHADQRELVRAEEGLGKGTSWGRVMHRLFEAMLRNPALDVRLFAANLLRDEERDAVELEEVLRVVEAVRSSSLWKRVVAADERLMEVPFALTVPRRDVGIDEDGKTLLHGTVDLVFREKDRWFVVDYKSDSTKDRIDALVDYYKPQVEHYARFWSQLTKLPTDAGLFFVDGCVERWM